MYTCCAQTRVWQAFAVGSLRPRHHVDISEDVMQAAGLSCLRRALEIPGFEFRDIGLPRPSNYPSLASYGSYLVVL